MPFVTARCPQCGGELQLDNGKATAFCMHCGSKIIVQEAINSVRIDNTHMIDTWMRMGDASTEGGNYAEAYEYYKQIIETQPDNWQAIYKKGKAAGWQSTLANLRISEATTSFGQAINIAPEDKKEKLKNEVNEEVINLSKALIHLRVDRFIKWPDSDEANGVLTDVSSIVNAAMQLANKSGFKATGFFAPIAEIINNSVMSAFHQKIKPDYLGDDGKPNKYQFDTFVERIGYCTTLIESAIGFSDEDDEEDIRAYRNLITLHNEAINSCSWEYAGETWMGVDYNKGYELTKYAKQTRREKINEYNKKIRQISRDISEKREKERKERERILREKAQKRRDEYWAKHSEEKLNLENERSTLSNQIADINKKMKSAVSQLDEERTTAIDKKSKKKKELSSLGIFKGKEKKFLQSEIDKNDKELKKINDKIKQIEEPFKSKIKVLNNRLKEINNELNRDR